MPDEDAFIALYRQIAGVSEAEARATFILHDAIDSAAPEPPPAPPSNAAKPPPDADEKPARAAETRR